MKIANTIPCHHVMVCYKIEHPVVITSSHETSVGWPTKRRRWENFRKSNYLLAEVACYQSIQCATFFSFYVFEAQMTVYHEAPLSSFLKAACLLCVNCTGNQPTHGMLEKYLITLYTFNPIRLVLVYFFDRHFYADLDFYILFHRKSVHTALFKRCKSVLYIYS